MNRELNVHLYNVVESPTLLLNAKAQELQKLHADFINLTVGEPDMQPPEHVKQAVIDAVHSGLHNRYTPVGGTTDLKNAVAQYFSNVRGVPSATTEVMASTGCKQAIFNALFATLNPNDEVLIVAPYWLAYSEITLMLGAVPKILDTTSTAGRLCPKALAANLNQRTKWLIINTPCNPSGVVYTREELKAIGHVLEHYPHVRILSDEIYALLYFDGSMAPSFLEANPELAERTVIVDGISKFLGLTGWRLGFCRASSSLIQAMTKVQSQSTSNPSALSQVAAIAGLQSKSFTFIHEYCQELKRRLDMVEQYLQQSKIDFYKPEGAFYVFLDLRSHLSRMHMNDDEFCAMLMNTYHLSIVPGSAFASSGFARLCLTRPVNVLHDAMQRVQSALQ